jgi:hypothetical protein
MTEDKDRQDWFETSRAIGKQVQKNMRGQGRPKAVSNFTAGFVTGALAPFEAAGRWLRTRRHRENGAS